MDSIEKQLARIEERLNVIEKHLKLDPPQAIKPLTPAASQPLLPVSEPRLASWLKDNWLTLLGALLILLSLGWFIGYAFTNDWIGPLGRVLIGLASSLAVFSYGIWMLPGKKNLAQALVVLGGSGWFLSVFNLSSSYHLVTPVQAIILLAIPLLITALMSWRHNFEGLAIISVLGAVIVPSLTEYPNLLTENTYLLMVDIAALALALLRPWAWPAVIAWLGTFWWGTDFITRSGTVYYKEIFIALYAGLFLLASSYAALRPLSERSKHGFFILLSLPFILWLWIDSLPSETLMINYAAGSLAFFLAGIAFLKIKEPVLDDLLPIQKAASGVIAGSGLLFAFLAANQYFNSREEYIIACLLGVAISMGVARYVFQAPNLAVFLSLGFVFPLGSISDFIYRQLPVAVYNSPIFWVLMAAFASFATALAIALHSKVDNNRKHLIYFQAILAVLFTVAGMTLVWNLCHNTFESGNIARGVAIVIYTIIGEFLLFQGKSYGREVRWLGIGVLSFVLLRLLLQEMWVMPLFERTLVFLITGVLLIATAVIDRKHSKI